jgi:hypothetical protein
MVFVQFRHGYPLKQGPVVNNPGGDGVAVFLPEEVILFLQIISGVVVAGNNHYIILQLRFPDGEMDVTDGPQLFFYMGGTVVQHRDRYSNAQIFPPFGKMGIKQMVGNHIDMFQNRNAVQLFDDVIDDRAAPQGQQRLGLVQRQRIHACGITRR